MAKRKRQQSDRGSKRHKEEEILTGVFGRINSLEDVESVEDEEEYELKPRHFKDQEEDLVEGLPVKGKDGILERVMVKKQTKEEEPTEELEQPPQEPEKPEEPEEEEDDPASEYADLTPQERLLQIQEDLSKIADRLMEDPEENVLLLARAIRLCSSRDPVLSQLAILSLVPVFKSIAPSYRIRPLSDAEAGEKVSKDVARLRFFEQRLVKYYKKYIDILAREATFYSTTPRASELDRTLGLIASRAACELAAPLRFFNYRTDLIKILARRVMKKPANEPEFEVFRQCVKKLEELLVEDVNAGDISFDVVRLLSRAIKHREFRVDESVMNVFLALTILSDYDPMARAERRQEKLKIPKKNRVHFTKTQRKQLKERREIDKEMHHAEQKVTARERERNQAQVLKMLLTLYLETLKARPDKLMASVLEGLAKYGHQVNLEMMGDFLQVLREIADDLQNPTDLTTPADATRQILLCVITSFSLASYMPGKKVHLDLNQFIENLYSLLPSLSQDAEIEFSHKTLRLLDPLSQELNLKPSVNVSTEAELLLRCLNAIFFNSRSGSPARALAFTKRLYLDLLQFPEKTSIATLKFIDKLLSRFDEVRCLYTTEDRVSNGTYHSEAECIERANTEVAVLWENTLLEKHYNPTVVQNAKALMNRSKTKSII